MHARHMAHGEVARWLLATEHPAGDEVHQRGDPDQRKKTPIPGRVKRIAANQEPDQVGYDLCSPHVYENPAFSDSFKANGSVKLLRVSFTTRLFEAKDNRTEASTSLWDLGDRSEGKMV